MTKDEDLAFQLNQTINDCDGNFMATISHSGLSKREWMATMIMQGIIANEELRMKNRADKETPEQVAVQMSDTLIKQLNKMGTNNEN